MEQALVLIADIESSKEIKEEDREVLQDKLQDELKQLNETDQRPLSPYTITLGDEFQAVFQNADGLFKHCFRILALLYPVRVRFSLGIGSIATPINEEQAIGMDGPAFHAAREGMEALKESGFLFNIYLEEGTNTEVNLINDSLQLLSHEVQKWRQNRLSIFYLLQEGYNYKEIADKLDISQPAFYKNKEAGALEVIRNLTNHISAIINQKLVS
ncbi:SatD family protein [Fodinibius salsisoli]|uniref:Helix-turn-helix domain-containing protein n=1 Tax=Fodinibius salsisoli TaxID=2820877 RepID=A0ABT3PMT9_9BACT|nr:SatD family protein [Fodinibius salsisoli]MCW9706449.1 helix-turn-helix domain-containing protein [Fodinibius salsisoli]